MNVITPTSLLDALKALAAQPGLTPIAGGTDLLVHWPARDKSQLDFLDLTPLAPELRALRLTDTALELGAMTTYWDVLTSPAIVEAFPLLAAAAREVGAIQIQTRGTWAGNIANSSPAADGVPVLLAYDAEVILGSAPAGPAANGHITQRTLPLHTFWTGYKQTLRRPGELILGIRLPRRPVAFQHWHKVGARSAQAITKVGLALLKYAGEPEPWRVVVNSVAPFVKRCPTLEAALNRGEQPASPAAVGALLAPDIAPIDDIRSTARYRAEVLSRIIYFALREAPGS